MNRMKTAIFAGVLVAVVGAPNVAYAALDQCGSNKMCAWGNNNYNWLLAAQIHGQGSWLDVFNNGSGEDNQTDSWANRSATYTGCLAADVDGGGDRIRMAKLDKDPNLAFFNSDEASAMRTKNGC